MLQIVCGSTGFEEPVWFLVLIGQFAVGKVVLLRQLVVVKREPASGPRSRTGQSAIAGQERWGRRRWGGRVVDLIPTDMSAFLVLHVDASAAPVVAEWIEAGRD